MFPAVVEKKVDPFAVEAAANYPYDVPNVHVDFKQQEIGIDVGYWRSVSHALNCFVAESFMDELAVSQKQESARVPQGAAAKNSRAILKVLDLVAQAVRFGYPPTRLFPRPRGHGGIRHVHGDGGRDLPQGRQGQESAARTARSTAGSR